MNGTQLSWIVGVNESVILGAGWYDRIPDFFGVPARESFPTAELILPPLPGPGHLTLLLGSALALHKESQIVTVTAFGLTTKHRVAPVLPHTGWQPITLPVVDTEHSSRVGRILLQTDLWRHGDFEPIADFREVGFLLAAVFFQPAR